MYLIVIFVAIFIISVGLSTIILPATLRNSLRKLLSRNWLWPISAMRLMLGAAFLMGAEETSMPKLITIIGSVMIAAGIALPILGKERIEPWAHYFLKQKDWIFRICGFIALLLGIALAMAGLPS